MKRFNTEKALQFLRTCNQNAATLQISSFEQNQMIGALSHITTTRPFGDHDRIPSRFLTPLLDDKTTNDQALTLLLNIVDLCITSKTKLLNSYNLIEANGRRALDNHLHQEYTFKAHLNETLRAFYNDFMKLIANIRGEDVLAALGRMAKEYSEEHYLWLIAKIDSTDDSSSFNQLDRYIPSVITPLKARLEIAPAERLSEQQIDTLRDQIDALYRTYHANSYLIGPDTLIENVEGSIAKLTTLKTQITQYFDSVNNQLTDLENEAFQADFIRLIFNVTDNDVARALDSLDLQDKLEFGQAELKLLAAIRTQQQINTQFPKDQPSAVRKNLMIRLAIPPAESLTIEQVTTLSEQISSLYKGHLQKSGSTAPSGATQLVLPTINSVDQAALIDDPESLQLHQLITRCDTLDEVATVEILLNKIREQKSLTRYVLGALWLYSEMVFIVATESALPFSQNLAVQHPEIANRFKLGVEARILMESGMRSANAEDFIILAVSPLPLEFLAYIASIFQTMTPEVAETDFIKQTALTIGKGMVNALSKDPAAIKHIPLGHLEAVEQFKKLYQAAVPMDVPKVSATVSVSRSNDDDDNSESDMVTTTVATSATVVSSPKRSAPGDTSDTTLAATVAAMTRRPSTLPFFAMPALATLQKSKDGSEEGTELQESRKPSKLRALIASIPPVKSSKIPGSKPPHEVEKMTNLKDTILEIIANDPSALTTLSADEIKTAQTCMDYQCGFWASVGKTDSRIKFDTVCTAQGISNSR